MIANLRISFSIGLLLAMVIRKSVALSSSDGGWSDVAVQTANIMTASQRERIAASGALDVLRPVKIRARKVDSSSLSSSAYASSHRSTSCVNPNVKIIHFQRHGEGYHNLLGNMWRELGKPIDMDSLDADKNPFARPDILDAPLTETGRQQCLAQKDNALLLNPQLVVVSPLQRAIQTALLSFSHVRGIVPWMAHEGCREELGVLVCNKRRPLIDIQQDFPHIDYSLIESHDDVLFREDRRETLLEKSDRAYQFLVDFVRNRPEKEIAIVSHSAWLFTALNAVVDCGAEDDDDSLTSWFLTSEIRSMEVSFSDDG